MSRLQSRRSMGSRAVVPRPVRFQVCKGRPAAGPSPWGLPYSARALGVDGAPRPALEVGMEDRSVVDDASVPGLRHLLVATGDIAVSPQRLFPCDRLVGIAHVELLYPGGERLARRRTAPTMMPPQPLTAQHRVDVAQGYSSSEMRPPCQTQRLN